MSENDRQEHLALLRETGKFRRTQEQDDTINVLMGDLELELDKDVESALELPQIRTK